MNQPQHLIEILVGEARRPHARHFVFLAQPSTQPLSSVGVEQPIRGADRAKAEVVRPAPQLPVQPTHNLFGIQQPRAAIRDLAEADDHPLDTLPRRASADVGMSVLA
jgi:hypothetical protein